jgi:hypothetical protein
MGKERSERDWRISGPRRKRGVDHVAVYTSLGTIIGLDDGRPFFHNNIESYMMRVSAEIMQLGYIRYRYISEVAFLIVAWSVMDLAVRVRDAQRKIP